MTLPTAARLGWAEYGDPAGYPVLALHGAPASRLMFAIADEAARRRGLRLIAPDRPGYGLTPAGARAHTLDTIAVDMLALADSLQLERFGLIGVSGGAPYAVAVAARAGQRVAVLALVSPMGPLDAWPKVQPLSRRQRWFFRSLPRRTGLLRAAARLAAAAFLRAPRTFTALFAWLLGGADRRLLSDPEAARQLIAMTQEAVRTGVEGAVADLAAYGQPWIATLAAVQAPALVWQGTVDRIVPVPAALRLAAALPRCRLTRLEGAGHFWVLEHADEVLAALAAELPGRD